MPTRFLVNLNRRFGSASIVNTSNTILPPFCFFEKFRHLMFLRRTQSTRSMRSVSHPPHKPRLCPAHYSFTFAYYTIDAVRVQVIHYGTSHTPHVMIRFAPGQRPFLLDGIRITTTSINSLATLPSIRTMTGHVTPTPLHPNSIHHLAPDRSNSIAVRGLFFCFGCRRG
jgi:hypothetical protein